MMADCCLKIKGQITCWLCPDKSDYRPLTMRTTMMFCIPACMHMCADVRKNWCCQTLLIRSWKERREKQGLRHSPCTEFRLLIASTTRWSVKCNHGEGQQETGQKLGSPLLLNILFKKISIWQAGSKRVHTHTHKFSLSRSNMQTAFVCNILGAQINKGRYPRVWSILKSSVVNYPNSGSF